MTDENLKIAFDYAHKLVTQTKRLLSILGGLLWLLAKAGFGLAVRLNGKPDFSTSAVHRPFKYRPGLKTFWGSIWALILCISLASLRVDPQMSS